MLTMGQTPKNLGTTDITWQQNQFPKLLHVVANDKKL